jgi:restriction endonuclease Mrr
LENGIHRCVHCESDGDGTYTYCENCGSINCDSHTKTERLEGEPICTGCAATGRFMLSRKYFYDQDNLEQFRAEYEAMPIHEKLMENTPLTAGMLLGVLGLLFLILTSAGFI